MSDRETPKRMIKCGGPIAGDAICPRCKQFITEYHQSGAELDGEKKNYCSNCGQCLLWEVEK